MNDNADDLESLNSVRWNKNHLWGGQDSVIFINTMISISLCLYHHTCNTHFIWKLSFHSCLIISMFKMWYHKAMNICTMVDKAWFSYDTQRVVPLKITHKGSGGCYQCIRTDIKWLLYFKRIKGHSRKCSLTKTKQWHYW